MDLLVNFDDIQESNKPELEYDFDSMEYYRVLRKLKMDPITQIAVPESIAFKFGYIWDPYTGTRTDKLDPVGPLYFDPDILIKYYYTNRLNKLWVNPSGDYSGYYDEGIGLGEHFVQITRGPHPEWYLFRLPIPDCYLPKDYNRQHITFGPELTYQEIIEIDNLAAKRPDNYKILFNKPRPYLKEIYKFYNQAIMKNNSKLNHEMIDKLIYLIG